MAALSVVPDPRPDSSEWRAWLKEFGPRLLLFARQQTRTQQDAEDLFQDALVKLVEKIRDGEFVGGKDAYLPYLYTTLRRLAIDLSRKDDRRKRREDLVSGDELSSAGGTSDPWFETDSSDGEIRLQLEGKLKELPAKFAEVIIMKIWGELTFAEIGEALDISQNTAASRYRYGLEALKRGLGIARLRGDLSI
ncbi:MAG: RNA polymerase sigma factor [Verrucomicrobiota bacterium]